MRRWIKRLLVLLIIGCGSGAAYRVLKSRGRRSMAPTPAWPAFEPAPTEPPRLPLPLADPEPEPVAAQSASETDWLPPANGECPPGYPIKANDNSHIYHVPGGRFYTRPIAERCYATEAAAQRDGYRRAKS